MAGAQDGQVGEPETLFGGSNTFGESHTDVGAGYWSVRLGFYDKDDQGVGNPFVDESVTVIEPVITFDYQASEDFGYNIQLQYDNVSSASIERIASVPGTEESGASGDNYVGIAASFRHRLSEQTNLNWHAGASFEYDYFSAGLGGGISRALEPQDAVISANLNAYFDSIDLIRWDGVSDGDDDRTSITGSFSWYQVLSPTTHGEFGLSLTSQTGFLATPINAVVVEDPGDAPNPNLANNARGTEWDEVLPDSRTRIALYGKVRRSINDFRAMELGGRVYTDDWGITAFDLTPKYIQQFDNSVLWDVRYRYYTQSEADAYSESFTVDPISGEERTQDSELADFDSHLLGTHVQWGRHSQWDFGLDYLMRSDDLDHLFFSFGWKRSF
ncbi:MAG: DUF3570 domain-containing protein [Planctomycetota bacterium]|nr:DUF3570 domain-containing protein [Planctomycetota bacterium]